MGSVFHWKDGWHFWGNDDGSVVMEHRVYQLEEGTGKYTQFYTIDMKVHVDPDSWASIVASVSKLGEAEHRWYVARAFHFAEPLPDFLLSKE